MPSNHTRKENIMEIKNVLDKPYTEQQKLDFIVTNNHQLGYEIRETEEELQAWGYTQEEIEVEQNKRRNSEIDSKIKELREMSLIDIMNNNKENIQLYNDVIAGLEVARPLI